MVNKPFRARQPSMDVILEQVNNLAAIISRMETKIEQVDLQVRSLREGGYVCRREFDAALDKMVDKGGRYWIVERIVFFGSGLVLAAALAAMIYTIGWSR